MTLGQLFSQRPAASGFGWLRLFLAIGILTFHSVTITYGSAASIPPLVAAGARLILPMFFALSGFLVATSLERAGSLPVFAILRLVRLMPALVTVVLVTALIIGPLVSTTQGYFGDAAWFAYLGNAVVRPHYFLPGVFLHNPRAGIVNGALWTIPVELCCYGGLAATWWLGLMRRKTVLAAASLVVLLGFAGWPSDPDFASQLPTGDLILPFLGGVVVFALAGWLPCHGLIALLLSSAALYLSAHTACNGLGALAIAYVAVWAGLRSLPALPGDYSYGLYLVGYPLQQIYVSLFPGGRWWQTWCVCLPVALGCAILLWHFVEKPILARKARFLGRRLPSWTPQTPARAAT